MKVTQEVLKSYARLIVRSGANVRPGQTVLLFTLHLVLIPLLGKFAATLKKHVKI